MSKTEPTNWRSVLRNYTADEGRPLETGLQEQDSNHLPLLGLSGAWW